jgi:hypothetical protein
MSPVHITLHVSIDVVITCLMETAVFPFPFPQFKSGAVYALDYRIAIGRVSCRDNTHKTEDRIITVG